MEFCIIIIGLLDCLCIYLFYLINRKNKQLNSHLQDYIESQQKLIEFELIEERQQLNEIQSQRQLVEQSYKNRISEIQSNLTIIEQSLEHKTKDASQIISEAVRRHFDNEKTQYELDTQACLEVVLESAKASYDSEIEEYDKRLFDKKLELCSILDQIKEWQAKLDAINQNILLQEQLTEKEAIYSVQLSEQDISTIQRLIEFASGFARPEAIYKVIWSEFLLKSFNSMILKQFGGKIPSNVIYCIENKQNHKKYIGKTSAEVSKRWTEHFKTSLNIGTVSRSKIHDALFGNWQNFTFSVLEVVDANDSLSEREKWYINLYESNIYGYNIKGG